MTNVINMYTFCKDRAAEIRNNISVLDQTRMNMEATGKTKFAETVKAKLNNLGLRFERYNEAAKRLNRNNVVSFFQVGRHLNWPSNGGNIPLNSDWE